jgi:hypothetical protein
MLLMAWSNSSQVSKVSVIKLYPRNFLATWLVIAIRFGIVALVKRRYP